MSRRRPRHPGAGAPAPSKVRRAKRSGTKRSKGPKSATSPTTIRKARRGVRPFYKVVTIGALTLATVGAGAVWLAHQSLFRVQHVQLLGLHHEQAAAVLAASGLNSHPAMLDVSGASVDQRLRAFAWIEGVSITKRWPNTLVVRVRERIPVAVAFDSHHALRYVDATGTDLGPAPLHANLPTLEYRSSTRSWPYDHAGRSAAFVASQLPRAFAAQVAVVSEDASGVVTLKMTTPVTFVLGPATQLSAKFVSVASVIAHSRLSPGDIVDVSVPGSLAVTGRPPS